MMLRADTYENQQQQNPHYLIYSVHLFFVPIFQFNSCKIWISGVFNIGPPLPSATKNNVLFSFQAKVLTAFTI